MTAICISAGHIYELMPTTLLMHVNIFFFKLMCLNVTPHRLWINIQTNHGSQWGCDVDQYWLGRGAITTFNLLRALGAGLRLLQHHMHPNRKELAEKWRKLEISFHFKSLQDGGVDRRNVINNLYCFKYTHDVRTNCYYCNSSPHLNPPMSHVLFLINITKHYEYQCTNNL